MKPRERVDEADYISMIEGKTSVLLAYSLQAGGTLGGASEEIQRHLYDYGLNIGLAFQIMDDYLDTFGDQAAFGKKIGGDILENKKTLLWVEAISRCNPSQLEELNTWYNSNEESKTKIEAVTQLYNELQS